MKQASFKEPIIFELGGKGRIGEYIENLEIEIPKELMRENLNLPELSQIEVVRHFTKLSQMNWGVDLGPYPLGSCTMKYNPRINEDLAWMDEVQWIHPLQDEVQGILELMYKLEKALASITGMSRFTLQPAAGANGEFTGCLIIRKYHKDRGEDRDEIIIPDSAHGTNPASAAMAGFKIIEIKTNEEGLVDLEELKNAVGRKTAGLMMTNPNTLGIFEKYVKEIAEIIHDAGGLMYYDGANLQGILGIARPGDFGFDIVHLNLHKTFSTPHGGGGPGSGPVGVKDFLVDYLPIPIVDFDGEKYYLNWNIKKTIGKVKGWYGNIPVLVRAYAYLLSMGIKGLKLSCKAAVVNTNYFMKKVSNIRGITIPFGNAYRKHEVVISVEKLTKETGVTALDVAKALLDKGLHAPTIYFPLIVKEALMFEFTDTETKENIDKYIEALKEICETAYKNPELLKNTPKNTSITRLDEVYANHPKTMCLSYRMLKLKSNSQF
ncbi:MAG: aminomethyl-transferring glycine dehydrogenase subunit GcvPB [Candidatus Methanomethylicaceae archaeon]